MVVHIHTLSSDFVPGPVLGFGNREMSKLNMFPAAGSFQSTEGGKQPNTHTSVKTKLQQVPLRLGLLSESRRSREGRLKLHCSQEPHV